MNNKKVFFVMIGVVVIVSALVIATVYMGDQQLRKQSSKLLLLKTDNQVIDAQQTSLLQAKKDIEKYSELVAIAKQIVPQDKDQARATREIISLAEQSGIKISSVGFPSSTLGQKPVAPKPSPTDDGTTADKPATPALPTISQVKPVEGISNVYQLDVIVVSDPKFPVSYNKLIDFLSRLEQNRRTAQVSQISILPDTKNRSNLNFTLTLTLYIKP